MAKSRRRREKDSQTNIKIITLGCSVGSMVLNLIIAYLNYFHPFADLLSGVVLLLCTIPNFVFVCALMYLSYVIHKNRKTTMRRVFISLLTLLCLEIFVGFLVIIAYVIIIDHRLDRPEEKIEPSTAMAQKIQKKFKCTFFESENAAAEKVTLIKGQSQLTKGQIKSSLHRTRKKQSSINSITEKQECASIIRTHTRTTAVYLATIYVTKFILLGSEALMVLFHYMNYLPA